MQHVWSEIEHDRNYKFKGALPKELKRRFYMIAGVLELVDKEFDLLTDDITKYANDIGNSVASGNLDIEFSDTAILSYLNDKFKYIKFKGNCDDRLILEMRKCGLNSILDLNTVIDEMNKDILKMIKDYYKNDGSVIGFIRDILILNNADLYFSQWSQNWNLSLEDIEYFEKYNIDIRHYSEVYNIELDETEYLNDEEHVELRN